jgi:hypothetical protein
MRRGEAASEVLHGPREPFPRPSREDGRDCEESPSGQPSPHEALYHARLFEKRSRLDRRTASGEREAGLVRSCGS